MTVKERLEKSFKAAQVTFKNQWGAIESTAQLLANFGFKPGVNVQSDYNLGIEKEYPIDWVVNEAIYLATGYGEIGDLNGGLQNGDWFNDKKPNINKGVKWILTNARLQTVKLTRVQRAEVKKSFEDAYRQHLRFVKPMQAIYKVIVNQVGCNCHKNNGCLYHVPEEFSDGLYDILWELRHEGPEGNDYGFGVDDLLTLLAKVKTAQKAAQAA